MTKELLKRTKLANDYLNFLVDNGYNLIDLNMIEPLNSSDIEANDIIFERNQQLYMVRSDWTDSLLKYNESFQLKHEKIGYYGPVIRNYKTEFQGGVELFKASQDEILESIIIHLDFIISYKEVNRINAILVNDINLYNLYFKSNQLSDNIKKLVNDKDISAIKSALGKDHELYKLMTSPVKYQYDMLSKSYGDHQSMDMVHRFYQAANKYSCSFILDLSFTEPQDYYNGLFFQIYLDNNEPILSGGQYGNNSFGIGINLMNGGLL